MKKVNKDAYKLSGEKVHVKYELPNSYFVNTYYTYLEDAPYNSESDYNEVEYLNEDALVRLPKSAVTFQKPRVVLAEKVAELIAEKDRLTAELKNLYREVDQETTKLTELRKQIVDRENWRIDWSELVKADSIIIFEEGRFLPEVFEKKDLSNLRFYVQGKIRNRKDEKDLFIFNVYKEDTYGYNRTCDAIFTNLSDDEVKKVTAERIKDKGGILNIISKHLKSQTEAGLKQLLEYCLPHEKGVIMDELKARKQRKIEGAEARKKAAEETIRKLKFEK